MNTNIFFSSVSDRWTTPSDVYHQLNAEFRFNLDPCPLDGTIDGLLPLFSRWQGKRIFCNPPYGPGVRAWLDRQAETEIAVYLLPARTDTRWFHEIVLPYATEIRFVQGRLKFGGAKNCAPFPSIIVVFSRA